MTQLTGLIGQWLQILSAFPLVALLARPGLDDSLPVRDRGSPGSLGPCWPFSSSATHRPGRRVATTPRPSPRVGPDLASAWPSPPASACGPTSPTQFSGTVFALLWGFPFLVSGESLDRRTASILMTVFVIAAGPRRRSSGSPCSGTRCARSWWCSVSSLSTCSRGRGAGVAGHRAGVAARAAGAVHGPGRARLVIAVRLRAHVQPAQPARHRHRARQRRGLRRLADHDVRSWVSCSTFAGRRRHSWLRARRLPDRALRAVPRLGRRCRRHRHLDVARSAPGWPAKASSVPRPAGRHRRAAAPDAR